MKLHLAPHACLFVADIVARELAMPLSLEWVDVRAKRLLDGADYFKINPKGQVPTLALDDGQLLTEGPVIVQCIADMKAGNNLLPHNVTLERYRVLEKLAEIHQLRTAQGVYAAVSADHAVRLRRG